MMSMYFFGFLFLHSSVLSLPFQFEYWIFDHELVFRCGKCLTCATATKVFLAQLTTKDGRNFSTTSPLTHRLRASNDDKIIYGSNLQTRNCCSRVFSPSSQKCGEWKQPWNCQMNFISDGKAFVIPTTGRQLHVYGCPGWVYRWNDTLPYRIKLKLTHTYTDRPE